MNNETLMEAIRNNDKEEVKKFTVDVNAKDNDGWTLLHYAAKSGNLEVVKLLVEDKRANYNVTSPDGNKPLHIAADYGGKRIVEFFIDEKKLNVDDQGKDEWTPLHYAANKGYLGLVKFLGEEKNATINAPTKDDSTPLHYAAANNRLAVVEFLIEKKANINAEDLSRKTPLQLAIDGDHQEIVKLLQNESLLDAVKRVDLNEDKIIGKVRKYLDDGADINYSDRDGWTPLHHAASRGKFEPIKFLIGKGANINAEINNGDEGIESRNRL